MKASMFSPAIALFLFSACSSYQSPVVQQIPQTEPEVTTMQRHLETVTEETRPVHTADKKPDVSKIFGKIQFVESFPDYKVQVVDSFPDLKVKKVDSFPDAAGKWQIVDSFPDYKLQIVDSFPDFKIQYVDSFPGVP